MGSVFGFLDSLVGINRKDNNQAARDQAAATREAADMAASDSRMQAASAQAQIENQQALAAAQRKANDLLGKPMDAASVELGRDSAEESTDLLGRKGRSRYQSRTKGNGGLVAPMRTGGGLPPQS